MNGWRLLVAEALVWLVLARMLVAGMRLGRWRHWLGPVATKPLEAASSVQDRRLAEAVVQAAKRLPGTSKCLPRAMALHWMLRRRERPSQLLIGVSPEQARGAIEDLHAWVEVGDEVLIGALDQPFHPLVRFGRAI